MKPEVIQRIEAEIERIVGPAGVGIRAIRDSARGECVRVEMAEAVWAMPADTLLAMLAEMPDHAGVLALRQAADQNPDKISCE